MTHSVLDRDRFDEDGLVFVDDLDENELLQFFDYCEGAGRLEPLQDQLGNGEAACPDCPDEFAGDADQYHLGEPVFKEFDAPDEFEFHAALFSCPNNHEFVIRIN